VRALFFVLIGTGLALPPRSRAITDPSNTVVGQPGLYYQTTGPSGGVGIGDWYTDVINGSANGGGVPHRTGIIIPASFDPYTTITIVANDAESAVDVGAAGIDEVRNGTDPTRYRLFAPDGRLIGTRTFASGSPDRSEAKFQITTNEWGAGTYILENVTGAQFINGDTTATLNDDDNSWSLTVTPDGLDTVAIADDISIGHSIDSYQFVRVTGAQSANFYFIVPPGVTDLFLRNFDMDGTGAVTYVAPDGTSIAGTVSVNASWNNGGDQNNGGDTVPVAGRFGVWTVAITGFNNQNQFILEANTGTTPGPIGGDVLLFDSPPVLNSIGDTVYQDTNGNGVQDPGEVGIPNVTVTLVGDYDGNGSLDTITTTTDWRGQYIFKSGTYGTITIPPSGLRPGSYTVTANAADPDIPAGSSASTPNPVAVTLAAATNVTNADIGFLPPSGVIGDRVFLDLNFDGLWQPNGADGIAGNADDETGLANIDVTLTNTQTGAVTTVTTDSAGLYRFTGLSTANVQYLITVNSTDPDLPTGMRLTSDVNFPPISYLVTLTASAPGYLEADFGFARQTSVGDSVFVDLDGDGVQDPGEGGIANVTVQLTGDIDGDGDPETLTTTTLSDGTYLFENLAPGPYVVTVDQGDSDLPYGSTLTTGTGTVSVTLLEGQALRTVDFGFRPDTITRGSIGDTVFLDLDGDGAQDPNEGGIAGVPVRLQQGGITLAVVSTDADGHYTFAGLVPGTYDVLVDDVNPVLVGTATLTTPPNPRTVAVPAGGIITNVDFGFTSGATGTGSIGDLVFFDRNGDGTRQPNGADGLPGTFDDEIVLANVTVFLRGNLDADPDPELISVVTDASGLYTFSNLPAGTFTVYPDVSDPDLAAQGVTNALVTTRNNPASVTLAAGQVRTDVDFGLASGATIGNQVFFDENGNGTQDAGEVGLAGVRVFLTGDTNGDGIAETISTVTDANGQYSFTGLPPGTFTVDLDETDPALPANTLVSTANDPTTVTLTSGQVRDDIDFGIAPAASIGDRVFYDQDGDGVQDANEGGLAEIIVQLVGDVDGDGVTDFLTTTTNSNGFYLFTGLPPGSYTISIDTANNPNLFVGATLTTANNPTLVTLTSGQQNLAVDFGFDDGASPGTGVTKPLYLRTGGALSRVAEASQASVATAAAQDPTALFAADAGFTTITDMDTRADSLHSDASGRVVALDADSGDVFVFNAVGGATSTTIGTGLGTIGHVAVLPNGDIVTARNTGGGNNDTTLEVWRVTTVGLLPTLIATNAGERDLREMATTSDGFVACIGTDGDLRVYSDATLTQRGATLADSFENVACDSAGRILVNDIGANNIQRVMFNGTNYVLDGTFSAISTANNVFDMTLDAVNRVIFSENGGNQDAYMYSADGATLLATFVSTDAHSVAACGDRYIIVADNDSGTANGDSIDVYDVASATPATPIQTVTTTEISAGTNTVTNGVGLACTPQGRILVGSGTGAETIRAFIRPNTNLASFVQTPALATNLVISSSPVPVRLWLTYPAGAATTVTVRLSANTPTGPLTIGTGTVNITSAAGLQAVTINLTVAGTPRTIPAGSTFQLEYVTPVATTTLNTAPLVSAQSSRVDLPTTTFINITTAGTFNAAYPGGAPTTSFALGSTVFVRATVTDPFGEADITSVTSTAPDLVFTRVTGLGVIPAVYEATYTATIVGTFTPTVRASEGFEGLIADVAEVRFNVTGGGLTAVIGDTVFNDLNGNGIQDAGEPGLPNVSVTLTGDTNGDGTTTTTTVSTNASGNYSFTGLAAGQYVVRVDVTDPDLPVGAVLSGGIANPVVVTLAAGQTNNTVDFGFTTTGSIGDRVFEDLNGNGIQDGGEPGLSNVQVQLRNSGGTVIATVTTDAAGNYRFSGLASGTYTVDVVNGTLPAGALLTTSNDPTTVALAAGQVINTVDFGYNLPLGSRVGDTVFLDRNGNGAQDTGEPGIGGVTVELRDGGGTLIGTVETDDTGYYLFGGLGAGNYTVTVVTSDPQLPSGTALTNGAAARPVTLDGTTNLLTVDYGFSSPAVANPATIGDRVFNDTNGDGVQDSGETGIPNITVTLRGDIDGDGVIETLTVSTDTNGAYSFPNLTPGTYEVIVDTRDPQLPPGAIPSLGTDPSRTVVVGPNQVDNGVDFGFTSGGSIGDRVYYDLNGNGIQDPGELGIAGVQVQLLDAGAVVIATATTDANGLYRFAGLTPARYTVNVVDATLPSGATLTTGNDPTTLTLAANQIVDTVDFGYDFAGSIIGDAVYIDADGDGVRGPGETALAGVTVTLRDSSGTVIATAVTDSTGSYQFGGLAAGTYEVTVDTADPQLPAGAILTAGQAASRIVTLDGATNRFDIDYGFSRGTSSGTSTVGDTVFRDLNGDGIQDPGDTGIGGVRVSLTGDIDGDGVLETLSAITDADGHYRFFGLPAGVYEVAINLAGGGIPPSAQITTSQGAARTVVVPANTNVNDVDFGVGAVLDFTPSTKRVTDTDGGTLLAGDSIAYTLVLRNQGSGVASDVVFTDNLPSQLTNIAVVGAPPGSTVSIVGNTVTISGFSIAAGGLVSFDITATVGGATPPGTLISNQGSIVSLNSPSPTPTDGDPTQPGAQPTDITTGGVVLTAVDMAELEARGTRDGVVVQWRTASEVDHLGFNVYRADDEAGPYRRINPRFLIGLGRTDGSSATYRFRDLTAEPGRSYAYLVVDVDVHGTRTPHGPVVGRRAETGAGELAAEHAPPEPVDVEGATESGPPTPDEVEWESLAARAREVSDETQAVLTLEDLNRLRGRMPAATPKAEARVVEVDAASVDPTLSSELARAKAGRRANAKRGTIDPTASVSIKIETIGSGVVRITGADLAAAGATFADDPRSLKLVNLGLEVPCRIVGEEDGRFDASDAIEFYAEPLDTTFTNRNAYWLTTAGKARAGLRMRSFDARPLGESAPQSSVAYGVSFEENVTYLPQVLNGEEENFFGRIVYNQPVDALLATPRRAATSTQALLVVRIQGYSSYADVPQDHHVFVQVNGTQVADVRFDGFENAELRVPVDPSLLAGDTTTVTVVPGLDSGVPYDIMAVDRVDLFYRHELAVEGGRLEFAVEATGVFTVTGLASANAGVFDVTDPRRPRVATGVAIAPSSGGFAASFTGTAGRRYLVVEQSGLLPAASMTERAPTSLAALAGKVDYLVVTPRAMEAEAQRLAAYRRERGLRSAVISVDDVYDTFSYGVYTPHAVRKAFGAVFAGRGDAAPGYATLVGDASFDYRNYLGGDSPNLTPTMLYDTRYQEAISDNRLVTRDDGSSLPGVLVGRLPARTATELSAMIDKVVAFEATRAPLELALAADDGFLEGQSWEADYYEQTSESIASSLGGGWTTTRIYLRSDDPALVRLEAPEARAALFAAFARGPWAIDYMGHGGVGVWAEEGVFASADVAALDATARQPVVAALSCLNGAFAFPVGESLAEAAVRAEERGAVAFFSPSGTTSSESQAEFGRVLFERMAAPGSTLGQAVRAAQVAAAPGPEGADIVATWVLLGDPALRVGR
jgi:protocatechuate 3,4-dioxygenase beta subunit